MLTRYAVSPEDGARRKFDAEEAFFSWRYIIKRNMGFAMK
jgi:hypothetical protein